MRAELRDVAEDTVTLHPLTIESIGGAVWGGSGESATSLVEKIRADVPESIVGALGLALRGEGGDVEMSFTPGPDAMLFVVRDHYGKLVETIYAIDRGQA